MNQYLVVGIVFLVVIALLATNKKLVETLKNIYKIEELRKRVIYTIGLLLVYRLGSFVVIPGINPNALGEGSPLASQLDGNGLLGLLNVFSGGCIRQCGYLCTRSHAGHHRLHHHPAHGYDDPVFPEDAEGR